MRYDRLSHSWVRYPGFSVHEVQCSILTTVVPGVSDELIGCITGNGTHLGICYWPLENIFRTVRGGGKNPEAEGKPRGAFIRQSVTPIWFRYIIVSSYNSLWIKCPLIHHIFFICILGIDEKLWKWSHYPIIKQSRIYTIHIEPWYITTHAVNRLNNP